MVVLRGGAVSYEVLLYTPSGALVLLIDLELFLQISCERLQLLTGLERLNCSVIRYLKSLGHFAVGQALVVCLPSQGSRSAKRNHPGSNPGGYLNSISHRCHPILMAFVYELTEETINLPLSCLQGDLDSSCPRKDGTT